MKTTTTVQTLAAIALISALIGCADDGGPPARRVETGGPQTIRTIDQIDDQDWSEAATKLTQSMMNTPNLLTPSASGGKRILVVDRIVNNTSQVVDTDLLTKTITVTLLQSGKVLTRTRDADAARDAQMNAMMNDKQQTAPDYRLYGKLIQTSAQAGNVRQSTFYFQLSLTDQNGNDVWEGQQPITKLGAHNSVGL